VSQPHTRNWEEAENGATRSSSTSAVANREAGCAEQLSRFFPELAAIRIPVQVSVLGRPEPRLKEATVLEYAAPECAIFVSTLPLEFDDPVRLERHAERCVCDATVVAVQYHQGRKAVAVKFSQPPCDWVMRP
jgi:hypothetical protein